MNTNESLLGVTQKFITPDIVQMFSQSIDEPADKTQNALNTVIPTLLLGVVNKGSTSNGAETILHMMKNHEFKSVVMPDKNKLRQGDEVLKDIFGNNLPSVVERLNKITLLNPGSLTKMLDLALPMVLGVLETKVKRENLSSSGLQRFLSTQKSGLSSSVPHAHKEHHINRSWRKIALIILIAFGAIMWMTGSALIKNTKTSPAQVISPPEDSQTVIPSVREFPGFLASAKPTDVPHTFQFEFLNFETGSSKLAQGFEDEVDQINEALEQHPTAAIRLEGFSDNSQDVAQNKELSFKRAVAVKEQLVERGINPDRIDTVANTSNTNRVSLIVTGVE